MEEFTQIGDTVIMTNSFFGNFLKKTTEEAAKIGAKIALKSFQDESDKKLNLSTEAVAAQLDCVPKTVAKYINSGHSKAGKLKAKLIGNKWKITQYNLNEFKSKL